MTRTATQSAVVSSDDEALILVDASDRAVGALSKSACHDGAGVLHRAFSLFVFNHRGELLIQKRHPSKRLWPAYWSNSCCSHPRAGEQIEIAAARRLHEELGLAAKLEFVYKFEYRAEFGALGTEHELCSVFVGATDREPAINTNEIADWRWIAPAPLDAKLAGEPDAFTPWFKMEWHALRGQLPKLLAHD
jgi:isopentenyl-diphosphate Delta-isomerase